MCVFCALCVWRDMTSEGVTCSTPPSSGKMITCICTADVPTKV